MILKKFLNLSKLVIFLGLIFWSSTGLAQVQQGNNAVNYKEWEITAEMVEKALVNGAASELFLITLREELAERRIFFQTAQNVNATRLKNLSDQLVALGEEPEQGLSLIHI